MAVKRWNGTSWEIYAGSDLAPVKVTDGRVGKTTFIGATTPTGMVDGDIWIDQDTATNAVVPTALLAKGDIFVATASGAYTRLAAGNNGESLYSDSTTSTGLRWQGDYNVGKNKMLNGDFSIWQRGTTGTNGFLADRWYLNAGAATSFSQTRQAFTPGAAPVSGYEGKYFWRNTITNVGSETAWYLNTYIEDVQTLAGQTATFSFWAKADSSRSLGAYLLQRFGNGGSGNVSTTIGTASLTTSWQRFTFTISIPSISGKTIGANNLIQIFFATTPGSGMVIDLWGMQLEAGSIATPFTTNTGNQQAELAACQRYYWQTTSSPSGAVTVMTGGLASSTTNVAQLYCAFPTTMRTAPSASLNTTNMQFWNAVGGGTGYSVGSITGQHSSSTQGTLNIASSGLTVNSMYNLLSLVNGTGFVAFSAEL